MPPQPYCTKHFWCSSSTIYAWSFHVKHQCMSSSCAWYKLFEIHRLSFHIGTLDEMLKIVTLFSSKSTFTSTSHTFNQSSKPAVFFFILMGGVRDFFSPSRSSHQKQRKSQLACETNHQQLRITASCLKLHMKKFWTLAYFSH